MAGIPAGSTVQVTFRYQHFGQILMNVLHWTVIDEGTSGTIASQTQEIADWCGDKVNVGHGAYHLLRIIPETCTLLDVTAQVVSPGRFAYRFAVVNATGIRGPSESANFDAVVTKRTDSAGPGKQSNMYIPGLGAADMAAGYLESTFQEAVFDNTEWVGLGLTMPVTGVLLAPVIFRRATGTVTPITSVLTHSQVRVMTRRTVGRGI